MRVLYIGDSHLRCFIDAAARQPAPQGMEEVFYGAPVVQVEENNFTVENGVLIPSSAKVRAMFARTGGSETIDIKSFDACVLVSWFATVINFVHLVGARRAHLPRSLFSLEQKNTYLLSEEVYRAYLRQGLDRFWPMAKLLEGQIKGPIVVVPRPLKSEDHKAYQASRREDADHLRAKLYEDLCRQYERDVASVGARFVPQPSRTITAQVATKREYCVGSTKLVGEEVHPERDMDHMNAEYGVVFLSEVRELLGGRTRAVQE